MYMVKHLQSGMLLMRLAAPRPHAIKLPVP